MTPKVLRLIYHLLHFRVSLKAALKDKCHRFVFILDGAANLTSSSGKLVEELHPDSYAFFPAGDQHRQASPQLAPNDILFMRCL